MGFSKSRPALAAMRASPLSVASGNNPRVAMLMVAESATPDRQVIRTASLEIFSTDPVRSGARAEQLAQSLGGFIVSTRDEQSANLELRVPEERMDEARQQLRSLGARVERESTSARDATRDYVDQRVGLRNLRAEEQQYLAILKRRHANQRHQCNHGKARRGTQPDRQARSRGALSGRAGADGAAHIASPARAEGGRQDSTGIR